MKKYYTISGTHCRSCELLIEQHVGQIPGVTHVRVDHRTGAMAVTYGDAAHPDELAVSRAVGAAGYRLGTTGKLPFISRNGDDWAEAITAVCIVFLLFLGYKLLSLDTLGAGLTAAAGPASALVIGLIAGISTCMALIGGLVLGLAARHAQMHPTATSWQKFQPHIAFNVGRIASFALFGGIIGAAGSVFRITGGTLGMLIVIAGATMIVLGIKLTGLAPRIQNFTLPAGIGRLVGANRASSGYSHVRAMGSGALTFVLPCAFTQMMQVFAISTGSFVQGALVMSAFALGTAPGLLGIGGLSSVVRGNAGRMFMKTAGVAVLLLGIWNISNGWNLTGITLGSDATAAVGTQTGAVATVRDGAQYLTTEQNGLGYNPNTIRVKAGVPFVWTINSTNSYTCAASISVPAFGILQNLAPGPNVIEFTPTKPGRIKYSCAMGMITGSIIVTN